MRTSGRYFYYNEGKNLRAKNIDDGRRRLVATMDEAEKCLIGNLRRILTAAAAASAVQVAIDIQITNTVFVKNDEIEIADRRVSGKPAKTTLRLVIGGRC